MLFSCVTGKPFDGDQEDDQGEEEEDRGGKLAPAAFLALVQLTFNLRLASTGGDGDDDADREDEGGAWPLQISQLSNPEISVRCRTSRWPVTACSR